MIFISFIPGSFNKNEVATHATPGCGSSITGLYNFQYKKAGIAVASIKAWQNIIVEIKSD